MNKIRSVERTNEAELALGISGSASWHAEFAHSPYIYVGGLPFELTEGDILVIFSQYGVLEGIKLHKDKTTGRSRGFCFLRYEDPRSCALAVDNFNGIEVLGRKISVNHVKEYKNAEEMDVIGEQEEGVSSEDEQAKRDKKEKRKNHKKREARTVEQMRAAMSQDPAVREALLEKERRREEKKRHKSSSRRDDLEEDLPATKKPKLEFKDEDEDFEDPMASYSRHSRGSPSEAR